MIVTNHYDVLKQANHYENTMMLSIRWEPQRCHWLSLNLLWTVYAHRVQLILLVCVCEFLCCCRFSCFCFFFSFFLSPSLMHFFPTRQICDGLGGLWKLCDHKWKCVLLCAVLRHVRRWALRWPWPWNSPGEVQSPPAVQVSYQTLVALPWQLCVDVVILFLSCCCSPEEMPGMSDVPLLSGISGLSFDFPFLSPLLFLLPSPLALSVLSCFCYWSILRTFFLQKTLKYFSLRVRLFCMALVEQLGDDSW